MSILNNINGLFLLAIMMLSYLAVSKNTQGDKEHFGRVHQKGQGLAKAVTTDQNEEMINQFVTALTFSAGKHRDQRRKDVEASPYINHPIALVDVLVNEGGVLNWDVLCAALLHDTIEDTAFSTTK